MDDLMERIRTAMEEYEESSALAMTSNDSVVSALGRRLHRYHQAHRKILEGVERWLDPHPGLPCTNIDEDGEKSWEPCELHVAAKGRISPEVLPLLAEAYGIEQ